MWLNYTSPFFNIFCVQHYILFKSKKLKADENKPRGNKDGEYRQLTNDELPKLSTNLIFQEAKT